MDTQQIEVLENEISTFHSIYATRHSRNFHADWSIALISIILTALVSALGVLKIDNAASYMALLSIFNAAVIAGHRVGTFGERAQFQRLVATEAENLMTEFRFSSKDDEQCKSIIQRLQTLRDHASRNLPRGEGIQAAINLKDELRLQKIEEVSS